MFIERDIPHLKIVVAMCVTAIGGYAFFSAYAVMVLRDATMTGDIIGTWKSFGVLAFGFWLGSSSGGKAKDARAGEPAPVTIVAEPGAAPQEVTVVTEPGAAPAEVTVMNEPDAPVPTVAKPSRRK